MNGGMNNARKLFKKKNAARKKWLQLKTRISWNTYINKRKQANKICAQKKKKWLNNKIIQIEENHRRNKTKKNLKEYGILNKLHFLQYVKMLKITLYHKQI